MYIYLDESGDLGFSRDSSEHYVIAVLATRDPIQIERGLKKYRKKMIASKKKEYRKIGEFKFNKAPDRVKVDILNIISSKDVYLGYVHVEKKRVYEKLRDKKKELYAYFTKKLLDVFLFELEDDRIDLIVDRQFGKKHRENFDLYIDWNVRSLVSGIKDINIEHRSSQREPCLQAVDFVCGAVYKRYGMDEIKYFKSLRISSS